MTVDIAALRALLTKTPRETVFVSVTTVVLGALLDQLEAVTKKRDELLSLYTAKLHRPDECTFSRAVDEMRADLEASRARWERLVYEDSKCRWCLRTKWEVHRSTCPIPALDEAAK